MNNSEKIQFGDLSVLGNSDFLQEYESAEIFQANEHTAVGLNNSSIQLFSASTDNLNATSIFGFELPNQKNNNINSLNKIDITDTDPVLKAIQVGGFDVVQNPGLFLSDEPQTHLIVYSDEPDGSHKVFFKSDPLSSNSVDAYPAFQIGPEKGTLPPIKSIKGFFPTYAAAYCNRLDGGGDGLIQIFFQDENNDPQNFALSNNQYLLENFYLSDVQDFNYSYYQDKTGTDYLVVAFILKVISKTDQSDMKNIVSLMAYNRKDNAGQSAISFTLKLDDDSFNPTCLTSSQDDQGFPQLYLGGNLDQGGYACYELNYDFNPDTNSLSASTQPLFSTSVGSLNQFNIGEVVQNDLNSLEFWGSISLKGLPDSVLMNALFENSTWSKPFPITPISRYLYLGDRISGVTSVFVTPNNGSNDMTHYWIDPETKALNTQSICLPQTTVRKFDASATYLNFTFNDAHSQNYPIDLTITASSLTYLKINGQAFCLSPGNQTAIQTDIKGRLKIIREVNGLEGEDFYIQASGNSDYLKVVTRANAQNYLYTRKLPNDNPQLDTANQQLAQTIKDKNNGEDLITLSVVNSITPDSSTLKAGNPSSLTYTAFSFLQTGVHVSTSKEEFDSLKLSSAHQPRLLGDNILDDLYDDFVSAWNDLAKDVSKFCASAENFLDKITDIVIDAGKMVVHFAENCVEVFLNTVEDVWKAIKFVYDALKDVVEDIINFLGALWYILKSIKPTAQALNKVFTISLNQLSADLTSDQMKTNVANFIADLTGQMPNSLRTDNTNAQTSQQGDGVHNSFFGSSAINWIISHIEELLGSNSDDGIEINLAEDALDFAEDAIKTVTDAIDGIYNVITNLDDFNNQVEMLSTKLDNDLETLLKDLDQLILDLFEAIAEAIAKLIDALTAEIDIPILSDIYEDLVGDNLSVTSLVSLIFAIPTAVIYGVIKAIETGDVETPFSDLDLSTINSFDEMIATLFKGNSNASGISTLLPFVSSNIFTTPETMLAEAPSDNDSDSTADELALCFGIAGLANSILSYLLFALEKVSVEETPPSKYQYGFKVGGFVLFCINGSFDLANASSDEKAVTGFLTAMEAVQGMLEFVSPAEDDKDGNALLTGIKGVFALLCFAGFAFSKNKAEDTLKIIHPTIDFIGDVALEAKEFPVSLLFEVIAWVISGTELSEG